MPTRTAITPRRPHALYEQHGYSPAILSGDLLFVSGMVGAREDGTPEPQIAQQITLAYENLRGVLDAAHCSFEDVVDVTLFMIDPEALLDHVLATHAKAFSRGPKPNITAVGVTWLAGFRFEIKAIARRPSKLDT